MDANSVNQFMSVIVIVAGFMSLYYAITGKGAGFRNDYPKAMQEEAIKFTRKLYWVVGPFAILFGILQFFYDWATWVSIAVIIPAIIVYLILFRRKFKEYLKKK
jgi:cytochrome bd-type quinol oxidase subunit 2